jgi:hypothetical protein
MSHAVQPPDGSASGPGRVFAKRTVLQAWEALSSELPAADVAECYDDLAAHPYPSYPERHHAPVKDLTDFVDPPAWERRLGGGTHVVFYRHGDLGAVIVYAGKREW